MILPGAIHVYTHTVIHTRTQSHAHAALYLGSVQTHRVVVATYHIPIFDATSARQLISCCARCVAIFQRNQGVTAQAQIFNMLNICLRRAFVVTERKQRNQQGQWTSSSSVQWTSPCVLWLCSGYGGVSRRTSALHRVDVTLRVRWGHAVYNTGKTSAQPPSPWRNCSGSAACQMKVDPLCMQALTRGNRLYASVRWSKFSLCVVVHLHGTL